jgi:hypothetical protein
LFRVGPSKTGRWIELISSWGLRSPLWTAARPEFELRARARNVQAVRAATGAPIIGRLITGRAGLSGHIGQMLIAIDNRHERA